MINQMNKTSFSIISKGHAQDGGVQTISKFVFYTKTKLGSTAVSH